MLMFVFFISCVFTSPVFCGGTFSCMKKHVEELPEPVQEVVKEQAAAFGKRVLEAALEKFDDNQNAVMFAQTTGMAIERVDGQTIAYQPMAGERVEYEAGSVDSKKQLFLEKVDLAVLIKLAKEKGVI